MAQEQRSAAERLEALRRRQYAPDVTDAEIAAYREAQREAVVEAPLPPPPRRPWRLRAVVVAVAVLVVGAGVGVGLSAGRFAPPPRPSPTPTTAAAGGATPTAVEVVAVPASTRADFVRELGRGRQAGVLAYFFRNPGALPGQLRTTTRAASTEYHGRGTDTVVLDPSALARLGGRMTVVLTLDRAAKWEWRAAALEEPDRRFDAAVIGGVGSPGVPMSSTIGYRLGAPGQLLVLVPDDVRWDVVVDFTD